VLARFDAIQAIMLPTLGEERRATYSPFLPISPKSGRVLQVPTLERDVEKGTITFSDEDGELTEVPGHRRPGEAAMAPRLGRAGRRFSSTTRCPARTWWTASGLEPRCARPWAASRRKPSTTSSSWTRTTRRSPSPRAMA
jgi:hypothetical protein